MCIIAMLGVIATLLAAVVIVVMAVGMRVCSNRVYILLLLLLLLLRVWDGAMPACLSVAMTLTMGALPVMS